MIRGWAVIRGWGRDLALGVRLAAGGGRSALPRLVLTAVGVGLGAALLLLAAALPAAQQARDARADARLPVVEPRTGDPQPALRRVHLGMFFRGEPVHAELLDATGPNPPLPPGTDRIPGHGEMIVSPALARVLASPDGALLRPRVPWTQVGTVGRAGLTEPGELVVYAGEALDPDRSQQVYGYGRPSNGGLPMPVVLLAMAASAVVLLPIVVLIAAITRVAAAARERRLAALRLVGADAGQARRLASGEALVGAVGGVLLGVGLLGSQAGAFTGSPSGARQVAVLAGLVLTALAVPVLLPWLLQRTVAPLSGGPPSWQLAIRRIQLDSATPARAAAGLAATLTAAVVFQTLLASAFAENDEWSRQRIGAVEGRMVLVFTDRTELPEQELYGLSRIDGVLHVRVFRVATAAARNGEYLRVLVAGCAVLRTYAALDHCSDGDVFVSTDPRRSAAMPAGGATVELRSPVNGPPAQATSWRLPSQVHPAGRLDGNTWWPAEDILATPAAVPADVLRAFHVEATVLVHPDRPEIVEHLSNALLPLGRGITAYAYDAGGDGMTQLRNTLVIGAMLLLALAAASLLIVSVEQIRERRRQFAALAASGVGTRTLAASVLWQAAVPFGVATVASLGVGAGLSVLLMRVFDVQIRVDWPGTAALVSAATAAVLLVTALTLPALRSATRPEALRTE